MTVDTTSAPAAPADTRSAMKSYWSEHSGEQTIETMMLDSNARKLHQLEIPEILAKAPDMEGKDVLELAAGIGRYTGILAQTAKSVKAIEFIEDFHQANIAANAHLGNIEFVCQDVTTLECAPNSFDVIFSNWIFMYLDDAEVQAFAAKAVRWLRPGGKLFLRESCFRQSGDRKRATNPTHYRHPNEYVQIFGAVAHEEDGNVSYFKLVSSSSVDVYRRVKHNNGQVCFHYVKCVKQGPIEGFATFQQFLDGQQYSIQSIARYEKIFGEGYVSTGGQTTTTEFVQRLKLQKNERVLDVGCGIGGGDFYMASEYGASVVGIDLSTNMVHRALEMSMKRPELDVEFEIYDATIKEFPEESFDVIYSRDTILHIEDKAALFAKFYRWLKPGGRLLITDYCRGEQEGTEHFKAYVASRGYHLLSPAQYGKVLEGAGFDTVVVEDRTEQFVKVLHDELDRTMLQKDQFIQETSEKDFDDIVNGWRNKLVRCGEGDQKWGLFFATKK